MPLAEPALAATLVKNEPERRNEIAMRGPSQNI
jgi:hypothetical protein